MLVGVPGRTFQCFPVLCHKTRLQVCVAPSFSLIRLYSPHSRPTLVPPLAPPSHPPSLAVANLAAANNYKKEHYDTAAVQAAQAAAQVYYIAGFFLTVSPDTINAVGAHAAEQGKTFCLNLSAPFIIDFFTDALDQALYFTDFVFCNETEAETYAVKKGLNKDDLLSVALAIAALPKASGKRARTVVFTQGSKSTIVACNGATTEYPVTELAQAELVDTNGAGDAMVGGFLSKLVLGEDVAACVAAGHFAAREIIQVSGCAPHLCKDALTGYGQ